MPKTSGSQDISPVIKSAILTLHLFTDKSFIDISKLLLLNPVTAHSICTAAKREAKNPVEPRDLYATLESKKPNAGRHKKIPEGSQESQSLRDLALQDREHMERPWPRISQELGIHAARSTIEKVMHQHHGLGRYKPVVKPPLDEKNMRERYNFAIWASHIPPENWVFTDECYIELNIPRKRVRITRPIGSNPYDYAEHRIKEPAGCRLMVWECVALGYKGPLFIWEKETVEEQRLYNAMVRYENQQKIQRQEERRRLSKEEGTEEYNFLVQRNEEVKRLDEIDPLPSGRKRRMRRPEWEFKEDIVERGDRSNGGIDWILYREKIARPLLYPFIQKIQRETGHDMWLVEDNAPAHVTCKRLNKEERDRLGIKSLN